MGRGWGGGRRCSALSKTPLARADHPPSPDPFPTKGGKGRRSDLGTILVDRIVNQNRPSIVKMPAQPHQGTLTLKALDPPELAAFYPTARRLKEAVKVLKRSAPLQPHLDILTIDARFGTGIACTKTRPRRFACRL